MQYFDTDVADSQNVALNNLGVDIGQINCNLDDPGCCGLVGTWCHSPFHVTGDRAHLATPLRTLSALQYRTAPCHTRALY